MNFNCNCGCFAFHVDTLFNNDQVSWVYITCQNCAAKYQIFFATKKGKRRENIVVQIKDVTRKCPQCQTNGFEKDWNKDTQKYDAFCEKCHYKESTEY